MKLGWRMPRPVVKLARYTAAEDLCRRSSAVAPQGSVANFEKSNFERKMRTEFLIAQVALLMALSAGGSSIAPHARPFVFNFETERGTSLEVKIAARNEAAADKADVAARGEIDREAKILSAWDSSSEFSRWVATVGEPVRVSRELFETLALFDEWRARTSGALDASAETVVRVWKKAERENREPSRAEIAAAVSEMRQPHWKLDRVNRTATHLDRAPIALNSFAKSYIAGARGGPGAGGGGRDFGGGEYRRRPGDPRGAAGDGGCGRPALRRGKLRAVGPGGDSRPRYRDERQLPARGVDITGRHYSHIVDPRTGMTAEGVIGSTVAAMNPADAGAMATAFSVLTPAESRRVAAGMAGVDYLIVTSAGERFASAGWSKLAAPAPLRAAAAFLPAAAAPAASAPPAWDSSLELTVGVELAQLYGNAHRPYLAIWVEDEAKKPVRTIALWFNKDRYLPEMRAWYRVAESRASKDAYSFAHSIASATRSPGRYTFNWDGKDDAGKPAAAGKYTVFIEAAREHGTYQLMRQQMDCSGTAAKVDLKGNTEIAGASLDYHRIATR